MSVDDIDPAGNVDGIIPLNKLKIAWVTNVPAPYRVGLFRKLANAFELNVFFAAQHLRGKQWPPALDSNPGFDYKYLNCWGPAFGEIWLAFPRLFLRSIKGVDLLVIGGWEMPLYWFALFLAKLYRIPTVVFYESVEKSHKFNHGPIPFVRSTFFRIAGAAIVPSIESRNALLDFGIPQNRIFIATNPIDLSEWASLALNNKSKTRIVNDPYVYLFVGQLIDRKNISNLITAFSRFPFTDKSKLIIVGEGPNLANLQREVANLGLLNRVEFRGHLEKVELATVYLESNCLVLPSSQEVWGMVVLEALSIGLVTIVSKECGIANEVSSLPQVRVCATDVESIERSLGDTHGLYVEESKANQLRKFSYESFQDVFETMVYTLVRNDDAH